MLLKEQRVSSSQQYLQPCATQDLLYIEFHPSCTNDMGLFTLNVAANIAQSDVSGRLMNSPTKKFSFRRHFYTLKYLVTDKDSGRYLKDLNISRKCY